MVLSKKFDIFRQVINVATFCDFINIVLSKKNLNQWHLIEILFYFIFVSFKIQDLKITIFFCLLIYVYTHFFCKCECQFEFIQNNNKITVIFFEMIAFQIKESTFIHTKHTTKLHCGIRITLLKITMDSLLQKQSFHIFTVQIHILSINFHKYFQG